LASSLGKVIRFATRAISFQPDFSLFAAFQN
jgi:hypothetical protein